MEIDTEQIASSPFTVGAIGAVVTALRFTPGASWWERTVNVVAGSLLAGFLSPALVEWLNMQRPSYASGAAFLVGLLGMSLTAAALEWVRGGGVARTLESFLPKKG
jgi:hypothetical protein